VFADLKTANASFNPSEEEINDWAYLLFAQKQQQQSIAVLMLNTELHPASWNAFDSLGEIFQKAGNRQKAIENYRRSLQLNPDNTNATLHLKEMGAT
jgi:tetratricopeptide (TPR) repeat protein